MNLLMDPEDLIFVAGGHGMVGSAIIRCLRERGYHRILAPTRSELDFSEQSAVRSFIRKKSPHVIVCAAAKVGGIYANMTYPADFLYDNLIIECNLIHEAHKANINRLLFLGSTCIYPRLSPQPIPEEALLTSALEPTNEAYALAKIAGVKLAAFYSSQYGRNYISAMPTNLYGPGDNYHAKNAHVIPALIRRFHEAKKENKSTVAIWGSGRARREFLHVDDLAKASVFLLERYQNSMHINVGSSEEFSILDLAQRIASIVGFKGVIETDPSMPDGTPRKKCDTTKINALGWAPTISLLEGLRSSYNDFLSKGAVLRGVDSGLSL